MEAGREVAVVDLNLARLASAEILTAAEAQQWRVRQQRAVEAEARLRVAVYRLLEAGQLARMAGRGQAASKVDWLTAEAIILLDHWDKEGT